MAVVLALFSADCSQPADLSGLQPAPGAARLVNQIALQRLAGDITFEEEAEYIRSTPFSEHRVVSRSLYRSQNGQVSRLKKLYRRLLSGEKDSTFVGFRQQALRPFSRLIQGYRYYRLELTSETVNRYRAQWLKLAAQLDPGAGTAELRAAYFAAYEGSGSRVDHMAVNLIELEVKTAPAGREVMHLVIRNHHDPAGPARRLMRCELWKPVAPGGKLAISAMNITAELGSLLYSRTVEYRLRRNNYRPYHPDKSVNL